MLYYKRYESAAPGKPGSVAPKSKRLPTALKHQPVPYPFHSRYDRVVGHNLSDRKLRSMEARADSEARKGWIERNGRWEAVRTPAGVLARGGELKAACRKREDCFRKASFDARWWVDHGLGTIPLDEALGELSVRTRPVPTLLGAGALPTRHPRSATTWGSPASGCTWSAASAGQAAESFLSSASSSRSSELGREAPAWRQIKFPAR